MTWAPHESLENIVFHSTRRIFEEIFLPSVLTDSFPFKASLGRNLDILHHPTCHCLWSRNMFFSGSLQDGIATAIQNDKSVVCFVTGMSKP